nr:MAG TPA_asm: Cytochrome c [Caudoviricetes sp.]
MLLSVLRVSPLYLIHCHQCHWPRCFLRLLVFGHIKRTPCYGCSDYLTIKMFLFNY